MADASLADNQAAVPSPESTPSANPQESAKVAVGGVANKVVQLIPPGAMSSPLARALAHTNWNYGGNDTSDEGFLRGVVGGLAVIQRVAREGGVDADFNSSFNTPFFGNGEIIGSSVALMKAGQMYAEKRGLTAISAMMQKARKLAVANSEVLKRIEQVTASKINIAVSDIADTPSSGTPVLKTGNANNFKVDSSVYSAAGGGSSAPSGVAASLGAAVASTTAFVNGRKVILPTQSPASSRGARSGTVNVNMQTEPMPVSSAPASAKVTASYETEYIGDWNKEGQAARRAELAAAKEKVFTQLAGGPAVTEEEIRQADESGDREGAIKLRAKAQKQEGVRDYLNDAERSLGNNNFRNPTVSPEHELINEYSKLRNNNDRRVRQLQPGIKVDDSWRDNVPDLDELEDEFPLESPESEVADLDEEPHASSKKQEGSVVFPTAPPLFGKPGNVDAALANPPPPPPAAPPRGAGGSGPSSSGYQEFAKGAFGPIHRGDIPQVTNKTKQISDNVKQALAKPKSKPGDVKTPQGREQIAKELKDRLQNAQSIKEGVSGLAADAKQIAGQMAGDQAFKVLFEYAIPSFGLSIIVGWNALLLLAKAFNVELKTWQKSVIIVMDIILAFILLGVILLLILVAREQVCGGLTGYAIKGLSTVSDTAAEVSSFCQATDFF